LSASATALMKQSIAFALNVASYLVAITDLVSTRVAFVDVLADEGDSRRLIAATAPDKHISNVAAIVYPPDLLRLSTPLKRMADFCTPLKLLCR
jgi:hypothetical protein